MRLMPILSGGLIAVVVQIGVPLEASGQALAQGAPLNRLAVVQFGMPADAKFVFCEGQDCPTRSLKHFAVATPVARVPMAMPYVAPIAVKTLEPGELAQTKQEIFTPPKAALAKKPKRKRVKVAIDCRSVPATK
jgi:hypothetical protein